MQDFQLRLVEFNRLTALLLNLDPFEVVNRQDGRDLYDKYRSRADKEWLRLHGPD